MERMNGMFAIGLMFLFAGLMGFAIPDFTGGLTEGVAKAGVSGPAGDPPAHIPKYLSGALLMAGAALVGIGLHRKR